MDDLVYRKELRDALYEADAVTMQGVKIINQFPAVDAVEVVRCRECKWYQIRRWNDTKPEYDCRKTHALLDVSPEDFCSYGERKGGDGNG